MNDEKIDRYLFDPSASPADEVRDLETMLAPLRYDADAKPLVVPSRARLRPYLAIAAALALVIAGGAAWLWTWPSGRGWVAEDGARVRVGETMKPGTTTRVRIARIGWMDVAARSAVTLLSTRSNRHRLAMTSGRLHVSIWAPPGSVAVRTPAGDVIDLGCEFVVEVNDTRTSVDVVSGWVQLDNEAGEVLVPGGATSEMRRSRRPAVPVFKTAAPEFKAAVRELDDRSADSRALAAALQHARRRDVFTLLMLSARRPQDRAALVDRSAELMPPRSADLAARARAGDEKAVWSWVNQLPLPPEKGWIRNWRDRFQ